MRMPRAESIEPKQPSLKPEHIAHETAPWQHYLVFTLLLLPTLASLLLLVSNAEEWSLTGYAYRIVTGNRATTQIIVQILSQSLCLIQIFTICRLINFATRIRFTRSPISLNTLGLWTALSTPTVNWSLPLGMIIASIIFVNLSTVMSVLWTGALTPVATVSSQDEFVQVPDWSNRSYIKEYQSEVDRTGLTVRDKRGLFTYSVGVGLLGSLVTSASSATTVDGSERKHAKLDNTGYAYYGRSYGVGAGVGLVDDNILSNTLVSNYTFQERGYDPQVRCIYNQSADFSLHELPQFMLYAAKGELPDSHGDGEYSVYVGHSARAIVAAGVTHVYYPAKTRYVGMAAGKWYQGLNTTQCSITFKPAIFNVSVGRTEKSISVQKLNTTRPIPDIDPSLNISQVATRQIELISNDLTSLYRSTLGDAFNASISDYRTSLQTTTHNPTNESTQTETQITLTGLENAIISLIDDILVGYASAQLVVGNFSTPTAAGTQVLSLRLGDSIYINVIAGINAAIIALLAIEALRTRAWRCLPSFDYTDCRGVVVGSSRGGSAIAACENEVRDRDRDMGLNDKSEEWTGGGRIGRIPVLLRSVQQGLRRRFQIGFGGVVGLGYRHRYEYRVVEGDENSQGGLF